ncbi:hypothetical protein DAEQUDRAFT_762839 [Daedalea quercina L-15889]|uniref:Uncharacterized protein n=1 Tax=Daedalea quercina L-15889 TaxID=1314783 RepID=A0A165SVG8_9APHY|nr:hypothetical protein DAEQUDRAFT_762839 [Daedalea quercina L-15889]
MIDITWDTAEAGGHGRKASTIHGWVTKLRGTLIDDESIRKRGIREMQYARRIREWKKEKGIVDQGNSVSFSFVPKKPPQPNNQLMMVRRHTTTGASRQMSTRSPTSSRSGSRHRRHESRPQLAQKAYSAPTSRLLKDSTRSGSTPPPNGQLVRASTQVKKDSASGRRSEHSSHHHRSQRIVIQSAEPCGPTCQTPYQLILPSTSTPHFLILPRLTFKAYFQTSLLMVFILSAGPDGPPRALFIFTN